MPTSLLLILSLLAPAAAVRAHEVDVLVYGATESGVMAAVAAARSGVSVALVEPSRFVGGLLAGGRPYLDPEQQQLAGGLAHQLFERTSKHYGGESSWCAEPHVAAAAFRQMLADAGVQVFREERLRAERGVRRKDRRIRRIVSDKGELFDARVYIDASYEGDLMAAARVPYEIPTEEEVPLDRNFSFVLCTAPANRGALPFPEPADYDPEGFGPWLDHLARLEKINGHPAELRDLVTATQLPNSKQAFIIPTGSTAAGYLEATYPQRSLIWQSRLNYSAGVYYFLSHSEEVPKSLREEFLAYGLCEDEYYYSNRWPHQIHIRAGRQMRSDFLLTWPDLSPTAPDGIAIATFRDERFAVPYRTLLPPAKRLLNLLVTGSPSAGPAVFPALRAPAPSMSLGHAAGIAAALAVRTDSSVQDIDTAELIRQLRTQNALLP